MLHVSMAGLFTFHSFGAFGCSNGRVAAVSIRMARMTQDTLNRYVDLGAASKETANWAATCAAQSALLSGLVSMASVRPGNTAADMRARKAPTDMRPTMHMVATDVHPMPVVVAGIRVEIVVPVAAVPPSPAAKMMRASWPAVDLVGEVGVLDGVTQAVRAAEGNRRSRVCEETGSRDGCCCDGECESFHGVLLIERCDRPFAR